MAHTMHIKTAQTNARQWKPKPKPIRPIRPKLKPIPMPKPISHAKTAPTQNRNSIQPVNKSQNRNTEKFEINNHGKGNFYISKEMISKMTEECAEEFITDDADVIDERLAFGYYKESVAMQINDNQIRIMTDDDGKHTILIDIDLHFKSNGKTMYLVAQENAEEFRHRVRWCIIDFMTRHDIYRQFGSCQLPQSSRNMPSFTKAIKTPPLLNVHQIHTLLQKTNFRGLPKKTNKRKDEEKETPLKKTRVSEKWLKRYCKKSWKAHRPVPVVVIKGKRQWIEWKKFVKIEDAENGDAEWIGISLRYHSSSKQWRIECMDYNAGRIYYQHRLVGLPKKHRFNCSYNELQGYVTTSLEIVNHINQDRRQQHKHNHNHNQQPAHRGNGGMVNGVNHMNMVNNNNMNINMNNMQGVNMMHNVNVNNGMYNNYDYNVQNNGYNIMMNNISNMTINNPYLPNNQPQPTTNYFVNNGMNGMNGHVDAGWQQHGLHSNLCYNYNPQQMIGHNNTNNINNNVTYSHQIDQNIPKIFDDEKTNLQMPPIQNETDYVVEQIVADVSVDDVVDDVMKGYKNSTDNNDDNNIMDEFDKIINDELGDNVLRDEDFKHLERQFSFEDDKNNHHQAHTQIVR